MSTRPFEVKFCDSWKGSQVMGCVWGLFPGGDFSPFKRFTSLSCSECQGLYMSKNYPVLLTQSSEPCWSNQLHQLVVAHVSQQVLQASFSSECGEFVAAAASAACRSGNGRVVQVLVHLTTELLILVSLWLLTGNWKSENSVKSELNSPQTKLPVIPIWWHEADHTDHIKEDKSPHCKLLPVVLLLLCVINNWILNLGKL